MCQSKANGGRRCPSSIPHRNKLFASASLVRAGLNAEDRETRQILDKLHEESLQWRQHLTEDEEDELLNYQMTGYVTVNSFLRGHGEDGMDSRAKAYIKTLDNALAKAPVGQERLVYRSVTLPDHLRNAGKSKSQNLREWVDATFVPGETITFPEYLSTTADSDLMIRNNEKRRKKGYHVALEIVTKSGAVLHQNKDENRKASGVQDEEKEILLGRGKTFKVEKVYREVAFKSTADDSKDSFFFHDLKNSRKATMPVIQLVEVD